MMHIGRRTGRLQHAWRIQRIISTWRPSTVKMNMGASQLEKVVGNRDVLRDVTPALSCFGRDRRLGKEDSSYDHCGERVALEGQVLL